jgi:hypothetical protein
MYTVRVVAKSWFTFLASYAVPIIDSSATLQCSWNVMCGGQSKRCHLAIHFTDCCQLCYLLAWTIVDPLQWSWVKIANYNLFGRSVESFGSCFIFDDDKSHGARYGCMITLGVFNFVAVLLANYESYCTWQLPSDFNESFYLTLSMVSILESFLVVSTESRWTCLVSLLAWMGSAHNIQWNGQQGLMILLLRFKSSIVFFVVTSLLISFMCLAILLQIFVPKLLMHQQSLHYYTRMNGMQFGVPMIWQDEQHSLLNFKMPCWVSVQRTCNKELIKWLWLISMLEQH